MAGEIANAVDLAPCFPEPRAKAALTTATAIPETVSNFMFFIFRYPILEFVPARCFSGRSPSYMQAEPSAGRRILKILNYPVL
jgi:hypothetical protein